ncbi:30S ribosome-binding factor RbfA [soil metagenome]
MLNSRNRRIEDAIRDALSQIYLQQVKDPRIPAVFTITRVAVGKDLRDATISFSQIPDDEDAIDKTQDALERSAGYVRTLLAKAVSMRVVPALHFQYDPSEKNFQKINTLLHQVQPKSKAGDGV